MARDAGPIDLETVSRNQLEPVFAIDAEGAIAFANERFYAISGLTREEVVGADYDLFGEIVDGDLEAFQRAVDSVQAGDTDEKRVELTMLHPEETPVPRRLSAETRLTPIHAAGSRVGVLVSLRDVATRKRYEKQLERQNERLSEFASLVAHDLRNPLNVAEGNLQIARDDDDSEHLATAADSLSRMWTIIDRTLTLAKQGQHVGEKDPVELSTVAQRCWSSVDTESATLTVDSDARILADADRLRNLFENLLRNAVEHSSKGQSSKERKDGVDGELPDPTDATADDGGVPASGSAAVRDVRSGTGPVLVRVGALDGEGFYLEDDAGGIPPDDRDRVFDLGYSTEADGTGYGLAIVKWIAEAHGWDVAATESSDGGARFEFTDVEFA